MQRKRGRSCFNREESTDSRHSISQYHGGNLQRHCAASRFLEQEEKVLEKTHKGVGIKIPRVPKGESKNVAGTSAEHLLLGLG